MLFFQAALFILFSVTVIEIAVSKAVGQNILSNGYGFDHLEVRQSIGRKVNTAALIIIDLTYIEFVFPEGSVDSTLADFVSLSGGTVIEIGPGKISGHQQHIASFCTRIEVGRQPVFRDRGNFAVTGIIAVEYGVCITLIKGIVILALINLENVWGDKFSCFQRHDKISGPALAYILALSTVSNIRGFDASDVDVLIYDEFIGEKHEKPISNEGLAFLNAIETISRNRELKGQKPLKVLCLSNTNDLVNPIFIVLKLVTVVEKMIKEKKDYKDIKDRGVSIYLLHNSPISRQKATTSLYRLAGEGVFTGMALDNDFSQEYMAMVKSQNLREYKAMVKCGELCIYKHKSKRQYYVTTHVSGKPELYDSSEIEIRRFTTDYYFLKLSYMARHVFFETYLLQILFERYFRL